MGWSCSARAAYTLDGVTAFCIKTTGSSNTWTTPKGTFFYEISRTEHYGGAITGSVMREVPKLPGDGPDTFRCRRAGSFRINGNGKIDRFPHLPREVKTKAVADGEAKYNEVHTRPLVSFV